MLMGMDKDRRGYERLPLSINVICQKVGQSPGHVYAANTLNVSSGGMLMEINSRTLRPGQLLSVEMSMPPTEGLLEFGGRFSTYARVLRVQEHTCKNSNENVSRTQQIALEFCQSPRLRV